MSGLSVDNLVKAAGRYALPLLPIPVKRHAIYFRLFRRLLPRHPQTFLDKVHWRILHDRRPLIAVGGDKMAMKHYAQAHSEVLVPETLWTGTDIASVLDVDFGGEWVLKPRAGSGFLAFGSGSPRQSGISVETVDQWRHTDHYRVHGVWGYGQSEPGFLIERRIPTTDGQPPHDLRVYVFHGTVRLIQVDTPRFSQVQRRFYSPEWEPYSVTQGRATLAPVTPRPAHLDEVIQRASEIGREYDFVRVDLYDVPSGVYFGEITPYPTGGTGRFSDPAFDRMLGDWWELPERRSVRAGRA